MRTIVFLLLFPLTLIAQKHDYNWVMGYEVPGFPDPRWGGLIMDFNTTPVSYKKVNTHLNFNEFGAACSDSSGNLLFYSNGIRIHNKLHQLMENGDTINPGEQWFENQDDGYPSSYAGLCIPAPGKKNYYYLFHLAWVYSASPPVAARTPLYYSLIDMNANGGLGRVVEKNIAISTDSLVTPVVVKHGNGRDWWLITGKKNTSIQYVFLITPEGIHDPEVQNFGPVPAWPPEGSACAISPDGTTYIRSQMRDGIRIYDFNRCTGTMGNMQFVPKTSTNQLYCMAFSPDSRMVYFQTHLFMGQVDLSALDVSAYLDTIAHFDVYADEGPPFYTILGSPQLGPDGKIYLNNHTSTFNLHVIHHPELPGAACDIQLNGVALPRVNDATTYNLPNYRLGEWTDSPCDTIQLYHPPDGFVRTVYEAARWQPEKQLQRRVVHLFPEQETASPPGAHDPGRPAAEPGQPLKKARLTPLQVQYAGENTPTPVKIKGND